MGEKEDLIERIRLKRSIRAKRQTVGQPNVAPQREALPIDIRGADVLKAAAGLGGGLPGIPSVAPISLQEAQRRGQTAGGILQREESIAAAPGVGLTRPGLSPLQRVGEAARLTGRAITGQEAPQLGDIPTQLGAPPAVSATTGFLASLGLPSNLAIPGGPGGAGAAQKAGKVPGVLARFGGEVSTQTIKKLRTLVDKLGVSKVFNAATEKPQFVGQELAPRVSSIVQGSADRLDRNILREIGVPDELGAELRKGTLFPGLSVGNKIRQTIQTKIDDAGKLFEKAFNEAPPDVTVNVKGLKGKIGSILKSIGVIDDRGALIPGIGKDPGPIRELSGIFSQLKQRIGIAAPKRIRRLVTEQPISREALEFQARTGKKTLLPEAQKSLKEASILTDELDIRTLNRLRFNLRKLVTGEKTTDRLVLQSIDALETSAENAGIRGLKEARRSFAQAKQFEKKFLKFADSSEKKLASFTEGEKIAGRLFRAQQPKNVPTRDLLRRILGKQGDEIINLLEANRILLDPKELGKFQGRGVFSRLTEFARRGIRSFEEKKAPGLRRIGRTLRPAGAATGRGLGLAQRAALRKAVPQDQ